MLIFSCLVLCKPCLCLDAVLCIATGAERKTALAEFYEQWKDDGLVMLKWIGLQVCMRSLSHLEYSGSA